MEKLPSPAADTPSFDDLRRIFGELEPGGDPRWGTMNRVQMVKHCRGAIELYLGRVRSNFLIRGLMRMLAGTIYKKVLAKSPLDTPKDMGTLPEIRAKQGEDLDFSIEVDQLLVGLQEVEALEGTFAHPMFGQVHAEDIQSLARHHTAHHANQFGLLSS